MAVEADCPAPALAAERREPPARPHLGVRLGNAWRNLFANALAAGRLALSAAERRDAVTGQAQGRFVLYDAGARAGSPPR